jgi:hypothetical protein
MTTALLMNTPTARAAVWTRERLDQLDRPELLNLKANAARLGETELAGLCNELLKQRPRGGRGRSGAVLPKKGRDKLVSRTNAFAAMGIWLHDPRTSWSGIRKADGMVVMALWRAAVQASDGGCACLLWSPNRQGVRPWSDSEAGRERLEHCKLALQRGAAQGLLVHGEPLEGRLPEDRARSVFGIDTRTVVSLRVELRGGEYWGIWGKNPAASPSL